MARRKNGFLNLCFSLIPGAGQMYQGFLKRGTSIMALFFGWITVCAFFGIDEGMMLAPVIWFFGFFDSLHRNSLTDAERGTLRDSFIFTQGDEMDNLSLRGFRMPVAILLIFFGAYSLLQLAINQMVDAGFLFWDAGIVRLVYDRLPKMVFSFLIIFLGVYLIIGRKKEIMEREEGQSDENIPWMANYHSEEPLKEQPDESSVQEEVEGDWFHEGEKEAAEVQSEEKGEEGLEAQPEEERKEDGGEQV